MKIVITLFLLLLGANVNAMETDSLLTKETLDLYLGRIGLDHADIEGQKNEQLLTKIIQHHLVAIPFENLSMHSPSTNRVAIDHDAIIDKILKGRMGYNRGGYCYEVNELFFLLLKTVGFDVTRHKASVWAGKDANMVPIPTHQLSMVTIDEDVFLADVGFGLFNIFQAVKLPREIDTEIHFVDSQNKLITFKKVLFDDSFAEQQQGLEGFIYTRWSQAKQRFERISSFAVNTHEADDYRGHNEFVQNNYRPFLDNVLFTRFNTDGKMIACVRPRLDFSSLTEIIQWINASQGEDSDFVIQAL